mgnify:CR=1 FL=1
MLHSDIIPRIEGTPGAYSIIIGDWVVYYAIVSLKQAYRLLKGIEVTNGKQRKIG